MWRGYPWLAVACIGLFACTGMGWLGGSRVRYTTPQVVYRSIPMNAAQVVQAHLPCGQVSVVAWDQPTVAAEARVWAEARSQDRAEQLAGDTAVELTRQGERIVLKCEPPAKGVNELVGAEVVLLVPVATRVQAEADPIPASATQAGAPVRRHAGSEDIRLHDCQGAVDAATGSGDIEVIRAAGQVGCMAGSGDITVQDARGAVKARTGSGDITIRAAGGGVEARAGSGQIRLTSAKGAVQAQTGSGDIKIADPYDTVCCSTGSGEVRLEAGSGCWTGGKIVLSTGSGEIDLSVATGPAKP